MATQMIAPPPSPESPTPSEKAWKEAITGKASGAADKEFSGCSPSPTSPTPRGKNPCLWGLPGFEDKKKKDKKLGSTTTKSSLPSRKRSLSQELKKLSERATQNSPAPKKRKTTSGKKKAVSPTANLNWELNQFEETQKPIGSRYGSLPNPETWWPFLQTSEWSVTGHFEQLQQIMGHPDLLSVLALYSGDLPELGKVDVHGPKPVWMLILKTRTRNFGAVIKINQILSSMNLEDQSTSLTCSDGSIGILFTLRSKDLPDLSVPQPSGLRATLNLGDGIQM